MRVPVLTEADTRTRYNRGASIFSAGGVSEYRVSFIDHAVVSLPAMRPLRVTAPKFGRTKELARARRLCYHL